MTVNDEIATFLRTAADKLEARQGTVVFPNFDFEGGPNEELPIYHSIRLACEQIRGNVTPHGEGGNTVSAHVLAALVRYIGDMLEE